MNHRSKKGFTLIELLVVISIIAILISILLPALGEARRSANIVTDVARLKQHGLMKETYVTDNKGRMPNYPGGKGLITYSQGEDAPGVEVQSGPSNLPIASLFHPEFSVHNGISINRGYKHDDMWKLYNLAVGDYAVEGTGVALLNELFTSAGANQPWNASNNYNAVRTGPQLTGGISFPEDYQRPTSWPAASALSGDDDEAFDGATTEAAALLNPSFRYTGTAIYGTGFAGDAENNYMWLPRTEQGVFGGGSQVAPVVEDPWELYRAFIQSGDFIYPSKKVIFWNVFADHNRNSTWYTSGRPVDIPVVMHDGSARAMKPSQELIIPGSQEAQEIESNRGRGGDVTFIMPEEWSWGGAAGSQGGAGDAAGTIPPGPLWFFATWGGPEGRDIR